MKKKTEKAYLLRDHKGPAYGSPKKGKIEQEGKKKCSLQATGDKGKGRGKRALSVPPGRRDPPKRHAALNDFTKLQRQKI